MNLILVKPYPGAMRRKRWLRDLSLQLALLLLALGLAVAAGEVVARRRYPNLRLDAMRQSRPEDLFMRFDPHMGWVNVPGRQVRFRRIDFDTQVAINPDGLRGPQIPLERAPGRSRILLLGDSFAFGHGVNDEETSAHALSRLLPATDVVNLGVTGYSTDQELLLLRERGLDWQPDLVILYLCANDLLDNGKEFAWGLYWKPRFVLSGDSLHLERTVLPERVPARVRLQREIHRHFVLYDVLSWQWARLRSRPTPGGLRPALDESAGSVTPRSEAHRVTRRLLLEMIQLCHARGIPFLLVVVPPFPAPDLLTDLPPPGTGARLDLTPVLAAYQEAHPDSALGFRYDTHWNARGHRVVAQAIAGVVRDQGWWPRSQ